MSKEEKISKACIPVRYQSATRWIFNHDRKSPFPYEDSFSVRDHAFLPRAEFKL